MATLLHGIVEREQLTVGCLTGLMANSGTHVATWGAESVPDVPVTYLGLERPEGLERSLTAPGLPSPC